MRCYLILFHFTNRLGGARVGVMTATNEPFEAWLRRRAKEIHSPSRPRLLTDDQRHALVPEINKRMGNSPTNIIWVSEQLNLIFPGQAPMNPGWDDWGFKCFKSVQQAYQVRKIATCPLMTDKANLEHFPHHLESILELSKFARKCLNPQEDKTKFSADIFRARIADKTITPRMKRDRDARELAKHGQTLAQQRREHILAALADPRFGDGSDIHTGDYGRLWEILDDNSVDMVVSDPEWNNIDHYEGTAQLAAAKLKPGKLCLVYSGLDDLDLVIAAMSKHLRYFHMFSIRFSRRMKIRHPKNVLTSYHLILVFCRLPKPVGFLNPVGDEQVGDGGDKRFHSWGQSEKDTKYYIEYLTKPNDLVVDPFGGGGTTPVVCKRLGRRCIVTEIDPDAAAGIRKRLAETHPEA
jgi:hypothetical protein